MIVFNRLL